MRGISKLISRAEFPFSITENMEDAIEYREERKFFERVMKLIITIGRDKSTNICSRSLCIRENCSNAGTAGPI